MGGEVAVLDASAILAMVNREPGWEAVASAVKAGAVASAVNLAEAFAKLDSATWGAVGRMLEHAGVKVFPFEQADAAPTAALPLNAGLSLGARACLVLVMRLGGYAMTADKAWSRVEKVGPAVAAVVRQFR